jgi:hypothetical protein
MVRIRMSSLVVLGTFLLLLLLLFLLQDVLLEAHADETILKVASDASIYFEVYQTLYANFELSESPALFLVGSPMLFMKLSGGNLFLVELCNLLLMLVTLRVGLSMFVSFQARMLFALGALVFPYFLFGFLGLNKEIYAMSSAIFCGAYYIRGQRSHLLFALLLGACARYYMLIALLVLLVTVPRDRAPRYKLIVWLLVAISFVAPVSKQVIPQYTAEGLLSEATFIGQLFSTIIDHGGYVLAYPLKYLVLLIARPYAYIIGTSEDLMGGVVCLLSLLLAILALRLLMRVRRTPSIPVVSRLLVAGFFAPVPIMWSEIMHWRYYSFVYFFFLYAVLLHMESERARRLTPQARTGTVQA